jgi:hypothetical protein
VYDDYENYNVGNYNAVCLARASLLTGSGAPRNKCLPAFQANHSPLMFINYPFSRLNGAYISTIKDGK